MKPEASEVLRRPGFIGVGDVLSSFHIQNRVGTPGRGITWLLLWICTKMIRALVVQLLALAQEAALRRSRLH